MSMSMFQHEGIDHLALTVRDVERSVRWYIEVLGFEPRHEGMWDGIPVFIGKGDTALALFPAKPNARSTSSSRDQMGMLHFALRSDRQNFLVAQEDLRRRGIQFTFQDHEISQSIYFHDPDGHEVEITTYELE
jgi:catechol-2,3-dioxygenase